ncbi:chromosome (plasmid) partitioning protein ParB [Cutibacterium acnes JCM 18916]|nr:chromosome (plasmid) partitioning protein ParB [Cutibacterium acnes JCM 18916]
MAAKHSGLGRGFGELFQRTDLDDDDEERVDDASTDGDAINERVGALGSSSSPWMRSLRTRANRVKCLTRKN